MQEIEKLRQIFSLRSEMGAPPEIHHHFVETIKDLSKLSEEEIS